MADAEYYRNYRRRLKERKQAQQQHLEDIILGDEPATTNYSPLGYLLSVMNDNTADPDLRCKAAIAAAPYIHKRATRKIAGDKPEEELQAIAAEEALQSKFQPQQSPNLKLVYNNNEQSPK